MPRDAALKFVRQAKKVVAGRGKNLIEIDLNKDAPDDDTLAAAVLGPTGNLKAPTIKIGDTLLVGFNPAMYEQYLG